MDPSKGSSAVLRNLRHLEPLTKHAKLWEKRSPANKSKGFVQPKDRVPFWNIVPGDIVRLNTGNVARQYGLDPNVKVRGEGRVWTINRKTNFAYLFNLDQERPMIPYNICHHKPRLLNPDKPELGFTPNTTQSPRPVHYSNLTLRIPGTDDKYAMRIIKKNLHYDNAKGMWRWQRFAVFRNKDGITEEVEVPWPKSPKKEVQAPPPDSTQRWAVEEETWLPWSPTDPIHLLPQPPRNSPHSVAEVAARIEAIKIAKKGQEKKNADLYQGASQGRYPGFQSRKAVKPPPVPQAPNAAEVLAFAKRSMAAWTANQEAHASKGGRTFAASDYLTLSPLLGPAAGGSWQLPLSDKLVGTEPFDRDPRTGMLETIKSEQGLTSKIHLDSMPIELMMKDDLCNERARAWRQKRWQKRREKQRVLAKEAAEEDKRNTLLVRQYVAEKLAAKMAASSATAAEQEVTTS